MCAKRTHSSPEYFDRLRGRLMAEYGEVIDNPAMHIEHPEYTAILDG